MTTGDLRLMRIDPSAAPLEPLDLDPEAFQSALPVQNYRLIFEDSAIGLAVGIWDTSTMQEAFGPYPGDEFVTVLDGSFSILDADQGAVTGKAGDSTTFRNGIPVSWKQDGYLRKIYLTLVDPKAAPPAISSASGGVIVLDGEPLSHDQGETRHEVFRNDAATMSVQHRTYGKCAEPAVATVQHELFRVLTGMMTLTDDRCGAHVFLAGDHGFIPKGTVTARMIADGTEAYHVYVTA